MPGERIIILGGPRCGKTTYARKLGFDTGVRVQHTDDLIGRLDWSAASAEVARWFSAPGPWIVEGVRAASALRKWLASHPVGTPCDVVVPMHQAMVALQGGQVTMHRGCEHQWAQVEPLLIRRGVSIRSAA